MCSYDHAGLGWSDPSPARTSLGEQTAVLDRLLSGGGVSGKVVLAPESFGALIAIDYARRRPERVAGIVFIDGAEPDTWFDAMRHKNAVLLRLNDWLMHAGCRMGIVRLLLPRFERGWVNGLPGRMRRTGSPVLRLARLLRWWPGTAVTPSHKSSRNWLRRS